MTTTDAPDSNTDEQHWTPVERENCKLIYNCEIIIENGSYSDVCNKQVPNDTYIVKYYVNQKICFDLTRGSRNNIFDMYWDKFRENLKTIEFSWGISDPRIWNSKKPQKKKED